MRTSLAEIISKIAGNFDSKSIKGTIIPIVDKLMKDEVLDVRLTLLKNISLLNILLGYDGIKKDLLPLFNEINKEK